MAATLRIFDALDFTVTWTLDEDGYCFAVHEIADRLELDEPQGTFRLYHVRGADDVSKLTVYPDKAEVFAIITINEGCILSFDGFSGWFVAKPHWQRFADLCTALLDLVAELNPILEEKMEIDYKR